MHTQVVTAVFERDGKWIMAYVLEVPGVNTQGKTMREARANLRNALKLMLRTDPECIRRSLGRVRKEDLVLEAAS
ncbi:MAG: type II toxin-antitoxin system HicB family antitoxin [Planctomycetota bacterium]|nr:type II toxin-antitoxin system HicB family antitoxin [Planctomycetota bacterium]